MVKLNYYYYENCFDISISANWIGHILGRNCLLHDAIEGQMMEVKQYEEEKHSSLMI